MWSIPNKQDAFYDIQSRLFESALADLVLARDGTGVLSEVGYSLSTGMGISIASGTIQFDGANEVSVGGTTLTLGVGHATLGRIDIVQASSAGTLTVVAGTAATEPSEPNLSGTAVKICAIYVPPTVTALTSAMLSDRRAFVRSPYSVYEYFVSTGEYVGSEAGFAEFLRGDTGPVGVARGFAIIDSTEGYDDVPAENITGDLVFRRFA
jgi:hypothetical protein